MRIFLLQRSILAITIKPHMLALLCSWPFKDISFWEQLLILQIKKVNKERIKDHLQWYCQKWQSVCSALIRYICKFGVSRPRTLGQIALWSRTAVWEGSMMDQIRKRRSMGGTHLIFLFHFSASWSGGIILSYSLKHLKKQWNTSKNP